MKKTFTYGSAVLLMALLNFVSNVERVSADTDITIPGGSGGDSVENVQQILYDWIDNIRMIGAILVVISIVVAFIIIGMSLGNAQKRALGVGAAISGVIGIIGVMKAPDIANYIIDQSQSAGFIAPLLLNSPFM